ncbi:MAG: hypothetical protein EA353_03575 [Puniceicoccaceae bacterium]|nr:MAG: hypothetical protein EA353_03575 [Puniceicoccaceae bacterium]
MNGNALSKKQVLCTGLFVALSSILTGESVEDTLPSILELERDYIAQNGGLANIQNLKSLIIYGQFIQQGAESFDFTLYRKRPNFYRMQVEMPNATVVTVYNGREAQRRVDWGRGESRQIDMDDSEIASLVQSSQFDGPFFSLRGRSDRLTLIGLTEVEGVPAYEIEVHQDAQSLYDRIWLDAEHFQEVKLRKRMTSGGSEEARETTYFSEFIQVDGIWLAQNMRQMIGDELSTTVKIDRVRSNVGLFNNLFEFP